MKIKSKVKVSSGRTNMNFGKKEEKLVDLQVELISALLRQNVTQSATLFFVRHRV